MRGLEDRVVVITGGTSGIGEACVRRFLEAGARVTFSGRRHEVAKAALVHLTRCAALEFGEHGVRVNAISPGPTLTEIFVKPPGGDAPESLEPALQRMEAAFEERLPTIQALRGMIRADDIAS